MALLAIWALTGNTVWPKFGVGVFLVTFFLGSFEVWKEAYQARKAPHIDVEIVKEVRSSIPHTLGVTPYLWGLRIRNDGVTANFQAWVKLKSGVTHLPIRRRPISFTREDSRQSTIITGAEDGVFFAVGYGTVFYGAVTAKALWYFDEEDRRNKDALIVPATSQAQDSVEDFEVTIVSDPPMETPWKRLYRLGPSNELHDVTSANTPY